MAITAEGELLHPKTGKPVVPRFLGTNILVREADDRRDALAVWLTDRANPFFARAVVNRVWAQLLGRGIAEPVDNFGEGNPPTNPKLLDALAKDFAEHGYDMRHLIRTIMLSRTYQLSVKPNDFNKDDAK